MNLKITANELEGPLIRYRFARQVDIEGPFANGRLILLCFSDVAKCATNDPGVSYVRKWCMDELKSSGVSD